MANNKSNPQIIESPLLAMNNRYVFYESLLTEHSPLYIRAGKQAQASINHFSTVLSMTDKDQGGKQIMDALTFLKNSAEFERQKELNFFQHYETAFPEIKQLFNININDIKNDYINFIININKAIKGIETFKKEVHSELNRISENRAAEDEIYQLNKRFKKKLIDQDDYDINTKALYGIKNNNNTRVFFKQSENQDKSFFNAIFNNTGQRKSILARLILEKYGAKLFSWQNNKLQLDERQKNALIALLTMKANEMFVTDLSNIEMLHEDKGKKIVESETFKKIVDNLLNFPNLNKILDSMVHQYNMAPGSIKEIELQARKIERIEKALKISFDALTEEEKKSQSFDEWRKKNGMTKEDIAKMISANETISVQTYYVGEDLALLDWLTNAMSAALGGGKNPTDDIEIGTLITSIEIDSSKMNELKNKLWQSQEKHFQQVGATSTYESFQANTRELIAARKEQESLIQEFMSQSENASNGLKDLISHINIHSTVKGYESAGSYAFEREGGFGGAAFGASLDSELKIIDSMVQAGGLSPLDIDNLFIAMINCGKLMIGHNLKKTIENYFSAFMGMLMFNDAEIFASDVKRWLEDKTQLGTVQDLHMYQLNGIIVPSSYILEETYKAMSQLAEINQYYRGVSAHFKTYDKEPIRGDWIATSQVAIENTKLERMHFLAGFVGLLQDIEIRLNNIG